MHSYITRDVHWLLLVAGRKNVLQKVIVLHAQYFVSAAKKNVVPQFTHRLSWTLHKIYKYKGFLWAKFSRIWTESKDIYRKIRIRENSYICIFYPVWRISFISPGTLTSLTRITDIILKIINCKKIFLSKQLLRFCQVIFSYLDGFQQKTLQLLRICPLSFLSIARNMSIFGP